MMTGIYVGVAISLICLMIGLVVTSTKIKMWKKVFILLALTGIGVLSYRAINSFHGHPAILQKTSQKVLIVGFHIDGSNRAIYLWLKDGKKDPISYKVPYDKRLKGQLMGLRKRYKGRPFKADITAKFNPMKRYENTVEEIKIDDHIERFPQKDDE